MTAPGWRNDPLAAADRCRVVVAAIQATAAGDWDVFGALIRQAGDLLGSYAKPA